MAGFVSGLGEVYALFLDTLPFWAKNFVNLFLIALLIFIYAVLIWKFYRFVANKDILELNLKRFNRTTRPGLAKTFAGLIYFFEYLIMTPLMVFLWFFVFTGLLLLLTDGLELNTLLIISATIVAAIRMTAYYKENLSRDLAKLLPLTLLGVSLTQSTLLNFQKVVAQLAGIPEFLNHIFVYLLFIMVIEFILRIFEVFFIVGGIVTVEEREEEVKSE